MSRRLLAAATLLLTFAAGPLATQEELEEPPDSALPLLATGEARLVIEGREWPIPMSETLRGPLFALAPIMRLMGGELQVGPLGRSFTLRLDETSFVFGVDSTVMTRGQELIGLSQAPRPGGGGVQVPLELLARTLGEMLRYDFQWSRGDHRLFALPRQSAPLEVDVDLVHLQGISTLVLGFPERFRYRVRQEGARVIVEMLSGEQVIPPARPLPGDPLVRRLRFAGSRIELELAEDLVVDHYEQSRPFRLVFDLYRRQAGPLGSLPVPSTPSRSGARVIVLDPGHGGSESGATGPAGYEEKMLTLELARRLARSLEARLPVRVELTRAEDVDLPLDTRTAIANQHGAELFISVHLNSSLGQGAHGAETYFLSLEASDARAAASAREENRSAAADPQQDLELILWDLAQSRYLADSQQLARLVQEELNQALGLRDRGVKQAPFRVLMGAAMPAILVELGFLSNPEEEARLTRVDYQGELIASLVRAVSRFFARRDAEGRSVSR